MHQQKTGEQKARDGVDMKSKIASHVHKVIWPCAKYPDYKGVSGRFVYGYLSQTLGIPRQEFRNHWSAIKKHVTHCLRTKRSYVVQLMKSSYLREY
jgi:hypothetical protein